MNLTELLKNKFIIALPLAVILLGCLYKFNEYKNITNDKEGKVVEKKDMKYYLKFLLIFYLVSLVFVIIIIKGYNKLTGRLLDNSHINTNNKQEGNRMEIDSNNTTTNINKINANNSSNTIGKIPVTISNPVEDRNKQLNDDIQELNMDVDTSELTAINILDNNVNKQKNELAQTQKLLDKRKQLIDLKKKRMNRKSMETINTGRPNF